MEVTPALLLLRPVLPVVFGRVDEAGRVFGQVVAGDGPVASSAAAAEPSVFALAALAFEKLLSSPEVMEDGCGAPDTGEGLLSHAAAAYLDERARPHIAVGFDVDEAARSGAPVEHRFSQSQEWPAADASSLEKERPVLWTRHWLHDGVSHALGFRHEVDQALVGAQVEGGWRAR